MSFTFGPDFLKWLQDQIAQLSIRFVILDSFTALRGSRARGVDIVKAEQDDLTQLDDLAKRTACAWARDFCERTIAAIAKAEAF